MNWKTRTIRTLAPAEVDTLVGWAAAEGWNPGLDDAPAFLAADAQGFIGAFVEGELVAGISAVAYDGDFGFVGLYICRPDRRGKGHGKAVWDAAMARLGQRTIGLDGVPEQQANYRKMGFVPAYRTQRLIGRFPDSSRPGRTVRPVTADMLPDIVFYDRQCFPAARSAFLERWMHAPRKAQSCVSEGAIAGYGAARQCNEGFKIGPLFADDLSVAKGLFAALAASCAEGEIHIDAPETNQAFIDFLVAAGFSPGFETARMYRGRPPHIDMSRVFCITTLELG